MRVRAWILSGFMIGGLILAVLWIPSAGHFHQQASSTVYYCPMHPTYTSSRSGDCPICNMRLVPREPKSPALSQGTAEQEQVRDGHEHASEQFKAICYLHNCPKYHQGKPCPMTVVAQPGEKVTCPICGTHVAEATASSAQREVLYWTDPMIPGYKSEKAGKSPMGMDLVPVYAEEGTSASLVKPEGYAPVLLTPQKQQLIGVKTEQTKKRMLTKVIRTVGRIAYDPGLYQAQEEYLQALHAAERAAQGSIPEVASQSRRLVDSSRIRLRLLGMSDSLIDEMNDWEEPDQSLLFSDPEKRAWVYASVYEYELPLVRVGQTIRVELPALPGKILEGNIRSIDPVLDPQTRTARVRAMLTDSEGWLKPEMYVNVSLQIQGGEALAVPDEAVFSTGEKHVVFINKGEGIFEPRQVMLGMRAEGYTEILTGIEEGEQVVISGNFLIDSESRLKAALEGMGGERHQHGQ